MPSTRHRLAGMRCRLRERPSGGLIPTALGRQRPVQTSNAAPYRLPGCNHGKPALVFAAHLANWELVTYVAMRYDLPFAVLYRPLNNKAVNEVLLETRGGTTGTLVATGPDAAVKLLRALQERAHIGMLVDEHLHPGA